MISIQGRRFVVYFEQKHIPHSMDQNTFRAATLRLSALPKEELDRAIVVAEHLKPEEREDLLDRLTDMHDELSVTAREQQAALLRMQEIDRGLVAAMQQFEDAQRAAADSASSAHS